MKKALITGITGQDGSYLAEILLENGYEVHGIIRRSSSFNTERIDHLYSDPHTANTNLHLHYGDLADSTQMVKLLYDLQPDEIYNLGAQSHVKVSFETPEYTGMVDGLGTLRVLEAVRLLGLEHKTRIYQASTSEMFGKVREIPQKETTPFHPRSPYGCAKVYAYWTTKNYREAYGMYACSGILFNHESPLRGKEFVTRKLVHNLVKVKNGDQDYVEMGNMDAKRDWGHAKDYVEGMFLMMQQDQPGDYVLSMEETHTVREFAQIVCNHLDLDIDKVIKINPEFIRPAEVDLLMGDSFKARVDLEWSPKYTLDTLIEEMVTEELKYYGN